jgi:DCN1-like protein 1/2
MENEDDDEEEEEEEGEEDDNEDGILGEIRHKANPISGKKVDAWFDSLKDAASGDIELDGIIQFFEQLGVDAEADIVVLILGMAMHAQRMLHYSREEFHRGMKTFGSDSPEELKKNLPSIRKLANDPKVFKQLYTFTFTYALDPGQRIMGRDMAIGLWELLFVDRFPLLSKWITYFRESHKHGVTKDLWQQFLVFTKLPGICEGKYDEFDKIAAWPLVLDEFVEYLRK